MRRSRSPSAAASRRWRSASCWQAAGCSSDPFYTAFMRAMEELGYHEGKNVAIHWEYAGGDFEPLPGLAAKLIALNPELIVTHSTPPALALKRLTKTVPVVAISVNDPV